MHAKLLCSTILIALAPVGFSQDATERAKIQGTTTNAGDRLGVDVATDGRLTVAGAPAEDGIDPGKVYVFEGTSAITQVAELFASDGFPADEFGYAVAIDGDRIVVGARQLGVGNGAAYVFCFDGTQWVEEQKFVPSDLTGGDAFGHTVDIQGDQIVVGANLHEASRGAVYLYGFDGVQWILEAKLSPQAGASDFLFGASVSIDDDRVAVGASFPSSVGWVEMFAKTGSTWASVQTLSPSIEPSAQVGAAVALQGDRLLIAAPVGDVSFFRRDTGLVFAFEYDGSAWVGTQTLVPVTLVTGDAMAYHLSMDGDVAAVPASLNDSAALDAGCVFLFHHDGTRWVEVQKLVTSDAAASDFLYSVALHGGMLVAGAYRDDDLGVDSGSIYVFGDSFRNFGTGVSGTGGLTPSLNATGSASLGGTVTFEFRDFVGGAPACYLSSLTVAEIPFLGGTLFADFNATLSIVEFTTPGTPGGAGEGDIDLPVLVPNDPSLSSINVYTQGFAIDPLTGVTMTNGQHTFID